ncbi:PHD and RING finger domain-containing protein 1, partial [Mytilus galloprovincialis]
NVNTCPVDRQVFHLILAKHAYGDKVYEKIPVKDKKIDDEEDEDPTYCEICGRCDREDRLLLCDGCDQGYHCECLNPPLQEIPVEEWFCPDCAQTETEAITVNDDEEIAELISENTDDLPPLRPQRRQIARTRASERVREQIIEIRLQRADRTARSTRQRAIISSDEEEGIDRMEETSQATTSAAVPRKTPVKRKTTKRKKKVVRKKAKSTTSKKKTTKRKGKKRRKRRKTTRKTSKRKQIIKKLVIRHITTIPRQPTTNIINIAKLKILSWRFKSICRTDS